MESIKIEGNKVTLVLIIQPQASKSGKTVIIAGTGGFQKTTATYDGKPVSASVNLCVPIGK